MADDAEKTEAPSSKKIQKAREEGSVSKSPELVGFIGLVVSFVVLFVIFPFWVSEFKKLYIQSVNLFSLDFTEMNVYGLALMGFKVLAITTLPFFAALVVAGVIGNVAQIGFLLSFKVLTPKLEKIDPIKGMKNVFSLKKLLDGILITLKVAIAFIVAFFIFLGFLKDLPGISRSNLYVQTHWFYDKALILIGVLLFIFLVMAVIDFLVKRYQYIKSLKMSKQEVKDEFKQQEGNQEVKAKIRQLMMKNAMSKMMAAIPTANVVVTNPTHYAVALRFDGDKDPAPIVVAKGIDNLAIRIKGIAREHDIEIIENPPLARELYRVVDVSRTIPPTMFEAVVVLFHEVAKLEQAKGKVPNFMKNIKKKH
ncbi:flagellar biosynthesis protein FlhB [Helicobacter sp. 13S00401-1]|uniref:flagellar biosynthesis protein FlhB n=1 Tax=Helicobacter sp. 13S00401-1 TaxID=1905758 RepID=UPI000BA7DF2C|nr:flagellar biosynthesis protein FlhB [Helicobacter sp. 13S00401-1]PAF50787.1 flagellar biosynthesis protein FlhB [Helicobacter sp. 13S00401-1]